VTLLRTNTTYLTLQDGTFETAHYFTRPYLTAFDVTPRNNTFQYFQNRTLPYTTTRYDTLLRITQPYVTILLDASLSEHYTIKQYSTPRYSTQQYSTSQNDTPRYWTRRYKTFGTKRHLTALHSALYRFTRHYLTILLNTFGTGQDSTLLRCI